MKDQDEASRAVLVFDGDCRFCRLWIERWQSGAAGRQVNFYPSSEVSAKYPNLPEESFQQAVQLIHPNGKVESGASAILFILALNSWLGRLLYRLYTAKPRFRSLTDWIYVCVARDRTFFSRITRFLWGHDLRPPTYAWANWLFLRWLGLVYLFAFGSLWVQIHGLIGESGILPLQPFLDSAHSHWGNRAFWNMPAVFWITGGSDPALNVVCALGCLAGVAICLGWFTSPALLIAWLAYLSMVHTGRIFLQYQWDFLLLEVGFLALFLGRWKLFSLRQVIPAPPAIRLLFLWLLARLMFCSGAVKLLSGDPHWLNLTALQYHYFTQPLPTPLAWFASQMPSFFQALSCLAMFGVELIAPFLLFLPRRLRLLGAGSIFVLQLSIALTGNYGFFNFLTMGLCLFALDDTIFPQALRPCVSSPDWSTSKWKNWGTVGVAVMLFLLTLAPTFRVLRLPYPSLLGQVAESLSPWCLSSGYGLFAVMTTTRPEIVIEGSMDGRDWQRYEFRYKPGRVDRPPPWVQPHLPRLDWQMWFAALGRLENSPWFLPFLQALLENRSSVTGLLSHNPFPHAPPRFLRAQLDDYRFTTVYQETKDWWQAEPLGVFCPEVSLQR